MRRKLLIVAAVAAVALGLGVRMNVAAAAGNQDSARIAALVSDMQKLNTDQIEALQPVEVKPYTLPGPSADVMRARLEETYTVAGIGEDTVQLSGWIVVRHGASRPAPGFANVSWETAVTDTEFVAMDLQGESKLFGPVHVSLDHTRPAIGQVGRINAPELARRTLLVANKGTLPKQPKQPKTQAQQQAGTTAASTCRAPVNVNVSMPKLGLSMATKEPAVWYSEVTTIPPVGQVASVTVEPVSLLSSGREVGTLQSGIVKFREVVRTVALSKDHQILIAALH
jgi:hypothetical protein